MSALIAIFLRGHLTGRDAIDDAVETDLSATATSVDDFAKDVSDDLGISALVAESLETLLLN